MLCSVSMWKGFTSITCARPVFNGNAKSALVKETFIKFVANGRGCTGSCSSIHSPLTIVRVGFNVFKSPTTTKSATYPAVNAPTLARWCASAAFNVAIVNANSGAIPAFIATRTLWSTPPFSAISTAVLSSVANENWRWFWALMAGKIANSSCSTVPSRIKMCMPSAARSAASCALTASWSVSMPTLR